MAERCKQDLSTELSERGEGKTEQEAKDNAKAAYDDDYTQEKIDGYKKEWEQNLKCAERECNPDDDDKPRHCEFYCNLSDGQYVKDPEKHDGKITVAYVVAVFYGCECKKGKAKEK